MSSAYCLILETSPSSREREGFWITGVMGILPIISINSNMSRQHSALLRGTSNDERLKAKTKKHRQPEQERRQDYPSSPPPSPQGNLELLLGVAQSMAAVARKYPEVRFKASDQKLLSLTITELTLQRQLEEHQREHNRAKAREVRGHLEHVRERKAEVQSEMEHISNLLRSGSPRSRKGMIACEMSPPSHYMPMGLIQRKIEEENREKATFQAMKKKEMCFSRVFEYVDRIADRLNLSKGEKLALSFKNFTSRIEAAIQAINNRQVELKNALKDVSQSQLQLSTLKAENELLAEQNLSLRGQVNSLTVQLQSALTTHRTEMAAMLSKCTELQQDFELIVKEKLDAETALSQQGKRHRQATRTLQRKAKRLRDCLRQAKYLQTQLRQAAKENRNNLECYSRETFNQIICMYTQELVGNAAKRKRELAEIKMERDRMGHQEEMRRSEGERKLGRMGIVNTLQERYFSFARERMLDFYTAEGFYYMSSGKCDQSAQTQGQRQGYLTYNYSIIQHAIQATKKNISIYSHAIDFTSVPWRQFSLMQTQTDQQESQKPTLLSHSQSQTFCHESSTCEVQVGTDMSDTGIQSSPITLTSCPQQGISIPPFIRATANAQTSTIITTSHLAIFSQFGFTVSTHHKQTSNQETNTENKQKANQDTNTLCIQTADQQTNTLQQSSIHHYHQIAPHLLDPIPNHHQQQEEECTQSILELLSQAQQAINVPEICLLRQQITVYREEIDRLSKTIQALKSEREKEHVFQFCY